MTRGDLVELPDGRRAYYQYAAADNKAVVVVLHPFTVPAKDLKLVKDPTK